MVIIPQNQWPLSFVLLVSRRTYRPERKSKTEKIKEETPKPRKINNSLTQAPDLFNQLSAFIWRDEKFKLTLWSASPVKKKEINATPIKMPIITKKLPKISFC